MRSLSVVLHLTFAAAVHTTLTFEFIKDKPDSVVNWFAENSYLPLAGLALVRVCAAVLLALGQSRQ